MKDIKINFQFKRSYVNTEEEKIKWFINTLAQKYSEQAIEISIKNLKKEIKREALQD